MRACNNAVLPGRRIAFLLDDHQVGWVTPIIATALQAFASIVRSDGSVVLTDAAALPAIARALADQGLYRWRGEAFDVRAASDTALPDGSALTQIDRGAIPSFGVQASGVHVNGLVRRPDGLYVWVARRARDKLLDPGKLDHIVAGGVPASLDPWNTLIKEAGEEAAIPPDLAERAVQVACFAYAMERQEGLRRDFLYCYDLELPESFTPHPSDGEVEAFELWPIAQVVKTVRESDNFKFNVNLVMIDLFLRNGLISQPEASTLRPALRLGRSTGGHSSS